MPSQTNHEKEVLTQVVVSSFPKSLLQVIDARAKSNKRSRAAEILLMLEERLDLRKTPKAA